MKGKKSNITENILKSYFERRLGVIMDTAYSLGEGLHAPRLRRLMRENLRFAESVLSAQFGPNHYELSVFINSAYPEIVGYYNSAGHDYPRSHPAREKDPNYYRKNGYAVVKLLESPPIRPFVIPFTRESDYSYSGTPQHSAIGSTIIYCFAPELPAALVVVCDRDGTFSEENTWLVTFVRGIGLSLLADIELCEKCVGNVTASSPPSEVSTPGIAGPSDTEKKWKFTWIHLSDMHFGAGDTTHRFDQRGVMRSIQRDIKAHAPKPIDRILVTGDIAFSGSKKEYEEAYEWLQSIARAAEASEEQIRLIPGNHDVRRPRRRVGAVPAMHEVVRRKPELLDDDLRDDPSRRQLLKKLMEYCRFFNRFKNHPHVCSTGLDWIERIPSTAENPAVRLLGLSTVWVSDQLDGRGSENGTPHFEANMVISNVQIEDLFSDVREDELVLLLSHHTPEWLITSSKDLLTSELLQFKHIHLCGHVHDPIASMRKQLGFPGIGIRFVAGAAHSNPDEAQKHGYAWGMIKYDTVSKSLTIGWAPRIYVKKRRQMKPDSSTYELDRQGFTWENLPSIS